MKSTLYASYKTIEKNKKTTLSIFDNQEFGQIRTLDVNGKVYFVANDIAKVLGYKNPTDAVLNKCMNIVKHEVENSRGQMRMTNIIPEGDVYRLIIGSNLPTAQKFERWVFDEVLPQIRKTGGYIPYGPEDDDMTIMAKALQISQRTIERKDAALKLAEEENLKLCKVIEGYKPKVEYVDEILTCRHALLITQIAFDYGLSAQALNKILCEERIQRRVRGQYILYAEYMGKGYTETETRIIKDTPRIHTLWTAKGRMLIHEVLKSRNIKPLQDLETIHKDNVTQLKFN